MRKVKKLLAVLLAAVMMLAMGTTAFATGSGTGGTNSNNGSITIDNAVVGQTYKIYQIFELESYNADPDNNSNTNDGVYAYTITSSSPWYGFVSGRGAGASYVELTLFGTDSSNVSTYYVKWNSNQNNDVAAFAKLALAYATEQIENNESNMSERIDATNTVTATSDNTTDTTTTVTFDNLELGYYLVDSSLGTLCALDTTNPNVTIKEKNQEPTVQKEVLEGNTYGDTNDANIGDTVTFQTTITAHKGAQNYVLHDKMSDGLTYQNVSSVVLKRNGAQDLPLVAKSDTVKSEYSTEDSSGYTYEVVTNNLEGTDPCNFHIKFVQAYLDTLQDNDQIVVTYTAILNESAVVGSAGNANKTLLKYGDSSSTEWDVTTTYTWELNVFKYTGESTPLAGAKFQLVRADNNGNYSQEQSAISFVAVTEETEEDGLPTYRVATTTETQTDDTITTTEVSNSTSFKLNGLDAGTYYLVETEAPNGYNNLAGPVKVVISKSTSNNSVTETVTYYNYDATNDSYETQGTQATNNTVRVLNNTGSELPSTGGTGTTIFYVLGAILVIGAGVLLVVKRRMGAEK